MFLATIIIFSLILLIYAEPFPNSEEENIILNELKEVQANIKLNKQAPLPRPNKFENEIWITGQGYSSKHPTLENLKPIRLNEMQVPKWHEDHFLVCRLLTKPRLGQGKEPSRRTQLNGFFAINLLIEDLNGDTEHLELYNFVEEPWMHANSIIVIKEPYLKYFIPRGGDKQGKRNVQMVIRVESPSDILTIPSTDLKQLKQIGASAWRRKEEMSLDVLWKEANEHFEKKNYKEAIAYFDRCIAMNADDPQGQFHLGKTRAFFKLNRFYEANLFAEKALALGASKKEVLILKAKAAYGLRLWTKAQEYFNEIKKEFGEDFLREKLSEYVDQLEKRLHEAKTGEYDLLSLYNDKIDQGQFNLDIADYTGPIKVVQNIPGKGRGMVTTETVKKGTLLMASKAYTYCWSNNKEEALLFTVNTVTNEAVMSTQIQCLFNTIQKLRENPQTAAELYSLYSGNGISSDRNSPPEGIIDTARIQRSFMLNNFYYDDMDHYTDNKYRGGILNTSYGPCSLFILASFVNHSCLPNTNFLLRGDVIFMYAIEDMDVGQELTIFYHAPEDIFSERQKQLNIKYGIKCDCGWCKQDAAKNPNQQKRIEELLKQYWKIRPSILDKPLNSQMEQQLEQLVVELRKYYNRISNNQLLRIHLNGPLSLLGYIHLQKGEFGEAEKLLHEALDSLEGTPQKYLLHPYIHEWLVQVYKAQNKMKDAQKFAKEAFELSAIKEGIDKRLFLKLYPTFVGLIEN